SAPVVGVSAGRGSPSAGAHSSAAVGGQLVQTLDHVAHVHVQLVQLVGVGQWHLDLRQLPLQRLEAADFTIEVGQFAFVQGAVGFPQVFVPTVDAGAYAPLVDRPDRLEQREQQYQQRDGQD